MPGVVIPEPSTVYFVAQQTTIAFGCRMVRKKSV